MTQTRKPLLVISYFSVTILWSIFLVIKETHKFPRIVFLPDSNVRADFTSSLSRTLNLSLTYLLKLVLPALGFLLLHNSHSLLIPLYAIFY